MYSSSVSVSKPAPHFEGTAVINGEFKELKLSDYKGKYIVFFFYPLDLWVTSENTRHILILFVLPYRCAAEHILLRTCLSCLLQHIRLPHWDHCVQRSCAWVSGHQHRGGRLLCRLPVHPFGLVRMLSPLHPQVSIRQNKKVVVLLFFFWRGVGAFIKMFYHHWLFICVLWYFLFFLRWPGSIHLGSKVDLDQWKSLCCPISLTRFRKTMESTWRTRDTHWGAVSHVHLWLSKVYRPSTWCNALSYSTVTPLCALGVNKKRANMLHNYVEVNN